MSAERRCPDCDVPLKYYLHEKIALDYCPQCHGLFLDVGELHRINLTLDADFGETKKPIAPDLAPKERHCPNCGVPMNLTTRSAVELDHCPKCYGFWLDNGELGRIVHKYERDKALQPKKFEEPKGALVFGEPMEFLMPERAESENDAIYPDPDPYSHRYSRYGRSPYRMEESIFESMYYGGWFHSLWHAIFGNRN